MKRTCSLLLIVLLLCAVLPSFAIAQSETAGQAPLTPAEQLVDADGNVIFTDAIVEKAIRDTLGIQQGAITPKQLSKLGAHNEQLNIVTPTPTTVDLSVLQLCTKLKMLYLENVTPTNLGAITAVKSLTYFSAKQIQTGNLRFLVGIKGLSDVWISCCPIHDISAVVDMPKLINFSIDTYVEDITPLYECKKLVAVALANLTDAQVNTLLDRLGNKLTSFGLNNCAITDETLERIAGMKLSNIMLDNVPVSSIAPIWKIKTLQDIELFNLRIVSLDGIQNLKKLKKVFLYKITGLTDYHLLFQQPSIKRLEIASTDAPNLEGIQSLKNLNELYLEELNGIMDITPVFALAKLKLLTLNTVTVKTFAGIEGLFALTDLTLQQVSGIDDYTPLSGLTKLRSVSTDTPEKMPKGLPIN